MEHANIAITVVSDALILFQCINDNKNMVKMDM